MEESPAGGLPPKRFDIQVGLTLSLSLAFPDLVAATHKQPIEIDSAFALLGPLVGMFAAALGAYGAGWLLIVVPLRRFSVLKPRSLTVAVAIFVAAPWLFSIFSSPGYRAGAVFPERLIFGLGLSCLGFVAAYLAWEGLAKFPRAADFVLQTGFSAPFVLAETFAFQWLARKTVGTQQSWGFFLLLALYLAVCGLTIRSFTRPSRDKKVFAGLVSLSAALGLALAASFAVENFATRSPPPASGPPNRIRHVILLTVDTLRRDALSCYGGRTPTPNIDRLADDGILFENAYAPSPWTQPSFVTMLSGLSPWVHQATRLERPVPTGLPSLAAFLKKEGYLTASIGSNPVLMLPGPQPSLSPGFDDYDFYPKHHRPVTEGHRIARRLLPTAFGDIASTDHLTRRAQHWVDRYRDREFFLWFHYYDPHIPYHPPPAFFPQGRPDHTIGTLFDDKRMEEIKKGAFRPSPKAMDWIRALYHGEVRYVDDRIGRFVATLKNLDLYEDTLIVFTSDHGEEHYEHRGIDHGHSLYEELLRVPLIVKLPGSSVRTKIGQIASLESVLPTILDLCGVKFDPSTFSSPSLKSHWESAPSSSVDGPVFSTGLMVPEREAVVFDGMKYIRSADSPREELYDLESDPGETNNIAFLHADKVARARELLADKATKGARLRKLHGLGPAPDAPLDAETIERLRSLGYVQ